MRVTFSDAATGWSIAWGDLELHLALSGGELLADYFGPALREQDVARSGTEAFGPQPFTRTNGAVQVGVDMRQVAWNLGDWSRSDDWTISINLDAADLPLHAATQLSVDQETGVLRKRTVLVHAGEGPAVEITAAASLTVLLPDDVRDVVHLAGRWGAE